jgi:hypothetical protein
MLVRPDRRIFQIEAAVTFTAPLLDSSPNLAVPLAPPFFLMCRKRRRDPEGSRSGAEEKE